MRPTRHPIDRAVMNYYELLDLHQEADPDEVRSAYRALVEIHHPDRMQAMRPAVRERASARLRLINEAYAVLRDPVARARYDAGLVAGRGEGSVPSPVRGEPRSRLEERLREIDAALGQTSRALGAARRAAIDTTDVDRRWERYLMAALSLIWLYAIGGLLIRRFWLSAGLGGVGLVALLALFLLGAAILLTSAGVSRLPLRRIVNARSLMLLLAVVLPFPLVFLAGINPIYQDVILVAGYAIALWKIVGVPVAAARTEAHVTQSRIRRLEDDLYEQQVERSRVVEELARYKG